MRTKLIKVVCYLLSWALYWIGDLVSKPMNAFDWFWLYNTYNNLMSWSGDVQKFAGNKTPWKACDAE